MIKLTELKDDEMLLVNNELVLTKEQFLEDFPAKEDREGCEIYTTIKAIHRLDARYAIAKAITYIENSVYKGWTDKIYNDITDEDYKYIQDRFDEILERNKEQNVSYYSGEEIQIDFEEGKDNDTEISYF